MGMIEIEKAYFPSSEELDRAEIALIAETGFSAEEIERERNYCVCGERIDGHNPMDCGHEAVSLWEYAVFGKAREMAGG